MAETDFDPNADRLREECGVFGIFGHPDAAAITALGLHALQHRGQEAAGIVSFDGKRFHSERRFPRGLPLDSRLHRARRYGELAALRQLVARDLHALKRNGVLAAAQGQIVCDPDGRQKIA